MKQQEIAEGVKIRHYKGGEYIIKAVGKHSESLEMLVYYVDISVLEGGGHWFRPISMFSDEIAMVKTPAGPVPLAKYKGDNVPDSGVMSIYYVPRFEVIK